MSSSQIPDLSGADLAESPRLAARALIGWLPVDEGALWLAGRRTDRVTQDYKDRVSAARQSVATRVEGVDQSGLLSDAPPTLDEHLKAFSQHAQTAPLFAQGFEVRIVDLTRVIAIQPHIFTEHAAERVKDVDASDMPALAAVTLPVPQPSVMPVQFDEVRQTWIFSSPNPNLRVIGHFGGEVQPGVTGFGFIVSIQKSFLQVANYQGRVFLRDGYHRAYGCLARGITHVPALARTYSNFGELALPVGLLSQDEFLGKRPPLLTDYLNDEVSAPFEMATQQKMIVVQALELSSLT